MFFSQNATPVQLTVLIVMCTWLLFHCTIHYLVVDHHVDGTMCGVGRQLAEVEGLVHDSLPSEGCVAVDQDGHHLGRTGLQGQSLIQQERGGDRGKTWTSKRRWRFVCLCNGRFILCHCTVMTMQPGVKHRTSQGCTICSYLFGIRSGSIVCSQPLSGNTFSLQFDNTNVDHCKPS